MLDRLRARAEDFLESLARERYRLDVSRLRLPGVERLYAASRDLFDRERIGEVQRVLAGATGDGERRARHLLRFLVHQHAEGTVAPELNQYLAWRNLASVPVGERRVPLGEVPGLLASSDAPAARAALFEAWMGTLDEEADRVEGLLARQRDAVLEAGYGSYVQSCEYLDGLDLRGLAREAAAFLAANDALYRDLLGWFLPRLAGSEPGQATAAEAWRLLRAERLDGFYAAVPFRERARALEGSGLDPTAGGRIRVEEHAGLTGSEGVVSHAVRVPDLVMVGVLARPRAGRPAAAADLHHLGCALHRAHTDAGLPFEYRRLGDEAVPRAAGFTFQGLLASPDWLQREQGVPRAALAEQLRFGLLLELLRLRSDIGQLRFELALFDAPSLREGAGEYAGLLTAATGLWHDSRAALTSVEPAFRVAARLRARLLAATLAGELRERFDRDWYRNPRVGAFLRELFAGGQRYSAGELSVQLTSAPLSFDAVSARAAELAA